MHILYAGLIKEYKNKNYAGICTFENFAKYKKNEKMLSIMGDACIKSDNLFMLPYIAKKLKNTSAGRKNAVYFLTVYLEKKLICAFILDNISLDGFSFPETEYYFSFIFESLKKGDYKNIDNKIAIKTNNKVYMLYKKNGRVYVDTYINGKLYKRRWYK
jgi:hypothetical protein